MFWWRAPISSQLNIESSFKSLTRNHTKNNDTVFYITKLLIHKTALACFSPKLPGWGGIMMFCSIEIERKRNCAHPRSPCSLSGPKTTGPLLPPLLPSSPPFLPHDQSSHSTFRAGGSSTLWENSQRSPLLWTGHNIRLYRIWRGGCSWLHPHLQLQWELARLFVQ